MHMHRGAAGGRAHDDAGGSLGGGGKVSVVDEIELLGCVGQAPRSASSGSVPAWKEAEQRALPVLPRSDARPPDAAAHLLGPGRCGSPSLVDAAFPATLSICLLTNC